MTENAQPTAPAKPPKPSSAHFNARIPVPMADALDKHCAERNVNKSRLARRLLTDYLRSQGVEF